MPTLKIDGQEVTVERGTTVLQAAMKLGIDIPTFCYHPGLSIAANCRMCLVEAEVRGRRGKPIPACHAQAVDDMQVFTDSERVQQLRKSVLEFVLVNHPVDCPICDQAGECVLQDHYFRYSAQGSRLAFRKVPKPKAKVLGPDVILDAERCIVCTRCVRFCDEVAKSPQLTVAYRGEHAEITTYPGQELNNPYALNVVDICPVGALTSRDFRFKTRVWFLQSASSVCPECSRGCKIRIDTYENVPRRYKPLENPQVNRWWMCDEGRKSYRGYLEGRAEVPQVTVEGGGRKPANVPTALTAATEALKGKGDLHVLVSPWLTNEDAFVAGELLAGPLSGAKVFLGGHAGGEGDEILRQSDKNPNRRGVETIFDALGVTYGALADFDGKGAAKVLVLGDEQALSDDQLAAVKKASVRVVAGLRKGPLFEAATVFLPNRLHWEKQGTFTNFEGVVQLMARATKASGSCKSVGWYALKLIEALGGQVAYASPEAIFRAIADNVEAFAGMTYANLGPYGRKLGEGAATGEQADADAPAEAAAEGEAS